MLEMTGDMKKRVCHSVHVIVLWKDDVRRLESEETEEEEGGGIALHCRVRRIN